MKNSDIKSIIGISVRPYSKNEKGIWDTFVDISKNGTFLFRRDFMEYHQDRFQDNSLMIFKAEKLIALLPANIVDNKVYSHQGLTYGGLILEKKTKLKDTLQIFREILYYLSSEKIKTLQLKLLPKIYVSYPNDELEYLLFITEAQNVRTDLLSVIALKTPLKIAGNRLEGVKKAKKNGLRIAEDANFQLFWNEILIPNLATQHDAKPVHSAEEIESLALKFPKNILQFNVFKEDRIVGGATIFETENVAHVQYISADGDKQTLGTLDFLFYFLISERFANKNYFDFGTSNENQGKNINEGLLYWKECFGARSIAQNFFEVTTDNYTKLDSIFL